MAYIPLHERKISVCSIQEARHPVCCRQACRIHGFLEVIIMGWVCWQYWKMQLAVSNIRTTSSADR